MPMHIRKRPLSSQNFWLRAGQLLLVAPCCFLTQSLSQGPTSVASSLSASPATGPVQESPGPYSVPGQSNLAGLDPNAANFKEVDYLGHLAERRRYTDAADFVYDFPSQEGLLVSDVGGNSLQIDIDNKPVLFYSESMSQTLFTLLPCGCNVPHLHSRAGKVVHVLKGTINIGFVEENGGRAIQRNLTVGQSFVVPKGLLMWVHNLECSEASYLDTWGSADPGILNVVPGLFKMPLPTVAAALGVDTATAAAMMHEPQPKIALGPEECIQRCNGTSAAGTSTLRGPQSGSMNSLTGGP